MIDTKEGNSIPPPEPMWRPIMVWVEEEWVEAGVWAEVEAWAAGRELAQPGKSNSRGAFQ